MLVKIAGIHVEVGKSLREHCETKVNDLSKYFDQVTDANVSFHKDSHKHCADVTINANGLTLHAQGEGADFYPAIDEAALKITKQLKKYKERISKHHQRREKYLEKINSMPSFKASHSVVEEDFTDVPEDLFKEYSPKVQRKDIHSITPMSVDEAVMQMDLMHTNMYIFQNPTSGRLNIVHRQKDGTVNWIDPHLADES
jgi:ribosomal subunit interface protein